MDTKTFLMSLGLYLLSGLINALLAFKTPEQWEAYAEKSPRVAWLVKALRKAGLDLPGLIGLVLPALSGAIAKLVNKGRTNA